MATFLSAIQHKAQEFQLNLGENSWYDLWHLHLDMEGEGNVDEDSRRRCIVAHIKLLQRFQEQASNSSKPWQSWVIIDPTDSSQDATYFHMPNPNRNNFPYPFEGVAWNIAVPELLAGIIDIENYQIGQSDYNGFCMYWIKHREIEHIKLIGKEWSICAVF